MTVPFDFLDFDGKIIAVYVTALPETTDSVTDSIDFPKNLAKKLGGVVCCCECLFDCLCARQSNLS